MILNRVNFHKVTRFYQAQVANNVKNYRFCALILKFLSVSLIFE